MVIVIKAKKGETVSKTQSIEGKNPTCLVFFTSWLVPCIYSFLLVLPFVLKCYCLFFSYVFLSAHGSLCLVIYLFVFSCLLILLHVYWCLFMSVCIYSFLFISVYACSSLLMSVHVRCSYISLFVVVFSKQD